MCTSHTLLIFLHLPPADKLCSLSAESSQSGLSRDRLYLSLEGCTTTCKARSAPRAECTSFPQVTRRFAAHSPGHWICCTPRVCAERVLPHEGCSRRDQGSRPVGGAHGEGQNRFHIPQVSRGRAPPPHRLLRKLLLPSHDAHRRRHKTKIVLYLLV